MVGIALGLLGCVLFFLTYHGVVLVLMLLGPLIAFGGVLKAPGIRTVAFLIVALVPLMVFMAAASSWSLDENSRFGEPTTTLVDHAR